LTNDELTVPRLKQLDWLARYARVTRRMALNVAKYGREVIDRVRVDQTNRLRHDKPARKVVKGARWLLLRNRGNIVKPQDRIQLNELLLASKRLATVYVLKDDLKHLWGYRYEGPAQRFWTEWYDRAVRSQTSQSASGFGSSCGGERAAPRSVSPSEWSPGWPRQPRSKSRWSAVGRLLGDGKGGEVLVLVIVLDAQPTTSGQSGCRVDAELQDRLVSVIVNPVARRQPHELSRASRGWCAHFLAMVGAGTPGELRAQGSAR
jgi:hypothetical protein